MAVLNARRTRRAPRRSGQAVVEFALIAPAALLLFVGMVEFAKATLALQILSEAARSGARTAISADATTSSSTNVQSVVDEVLAGAGMEVDSATVVLGLRTTPGTPDTVKVSYPHTFSLVGALLEWVTGDRSITLSSRAVMRNE
jgi:Flp pilus assembly protein TadG